MGESEQIPTIGLISIVGGHVTLNVAMNDAEVTQFLEMTSHEPGFEVALAFEKYTGRVTAMQAHPELKYKLRERAKQAMKERGSKKSRIHVPPEVAGWSL